MQVYELIVRNRAVLGNSDDMTLVRTSIGVDRMHVMFDNAEWADFPITVTFANGDTKVSQSLPVTPLDSDEWVLEGECVIPWEVVTEVGAIRVTFQGTDAQGNHIITAYGAPLSVEQSGDSEMGDIPEDAPSVDQWNQAYADAMAAVNSLNAKIAEVDAAIQAFVDQVLPIATTESVGLMKPDGRTAIVDENGTLSVQTAYELPIATESVLGGVMVDGESIEVDENGALSLLSTTRNAIANLRRLASTAFDTTFDEGGNLTAAKVLPESLPIATILALGGVKPDGTTTAVNANGTISAIGVSASGITGVIPAANLPSYVDDVVDAYIVGDTALASDWLSLESGGESLTPEQGKIYVIVSPGDYLNQSYRWSGTAYVAIGNPLDIATQAEAEAGSDNVKVMTPLRVAQAIAALASGAQIATVQAAGIVKPDGTTITVDSDGTIHGASTYEPTIATQAEAEAGTGNAKLMTPLRVAQAISAQTAALERRVTALEGGTSGSGASVENGILVLGGDSSVSNGVLQVDGASVESGILDFG